MAITPADVRRAPHLPGGPDVDFPEVMSLYRWYRCCILQALPRSAKPVLHGKSYVDQLVFERLSLICGGSCLLCRYSISTAHVSQHRLM